MNLKVIATILFLFFFGAIIIYVATQQSDSSVKRHAPNKSEDAFRSMKIN